jgi:hypothetical protein
LIRSAIRHRAIKRQMPHRYHDIPASIMHSVHRPNQKLTDSRPNVVVANYAARAGDQ